MSPRNGLLLDVFYWCYGSARRSRSSGLPQLDGRLGPAHGQPGITRPLTLRRPGSSRSLTSVGREAISGMASTVGV